MTTDDVNEDFAPGLGNIPPAALEDTAPPQRRRWPWVVGFVVLALAGLVAAGPSLISSSWLNGKIRDYLHENLEDGTRVDFAALDVSWFDGIRVTELQVRRSANDEHPLLDAPLVEFDADVWPLFLRRLDVRKFVFHDPVVRVERTREGALNTEDVVKTRKKKKRKKDGTEQEAIVLPEIDVPVEVRGLRLVIVGDDGREVERGGIAFAGHLTTRKGPTTFDLHVPVGGGAMDVEGQAAIFDAEGVMLPLDALAVDTTVTLQALDAAENRDLLELFLEKAPKAGVLDGRVVVNSVGKKAKGEVELVVRDVAVGEAAAPGTPREDLRITGAFETDGTSFAVRDGLVRGEGLEAHAAFSGTLAAIDGKATVRADVERSAAALRAMGIDVPDGVAGRVTGDLVFRPSPSRGDGTLVIEGLRAPAAVEGGEPLAIDRVEGELAVVPGDGKISVERVQVRVPDELTATVTGDVGHDGTFDLAVETGGQVAAILRRAKAMGLVPQGVALAGTLDGAFGVRRGADEPGVAVTIERASLRDEGVLVRADGGMDADGALHVRVGGEGRIERLLAAGGADERLRSLSGTFSFAASADGPADGLAAELESLRIDGDLALAASGRMRPDGRIEGQATLDGRIPDAVAIARGLGFVEGELPVDGRIHGDVRVAGTRERPEVPGISLRIDDGPLDVDVRGAISELGSVEATIEAAAELDTLLAVAHAQGVLARPHTTGGRVQVTAVVAGSREKPEVPKATLTVNGPFAVRADAALDADGAAHVRADLSGTLGAVTRLVAALRDTEEQPVAGTFEGALSLDGPLDAPRVRLSKLLVRSEGLTLDGAAAMRPDGSAEGSVSVRGPLEGAFAIAHALGQLPDVSGTGTVDVALDGRLAGNADARTVSGSLTGTVHDLVMLRADTPEAAYRESRLTFSVPSFSRPLGTPDAAEPPRPVTLRVEADSGLRLEAHATGGTDGVPLDLRAELTSPVQPLIDASAVFTGGGAGMEVGGSVATAEPLVFRGDVSAGREHAEGWTGGTVLRLTDVVAPYVAISTGTVRAEIAKGEVLLSPIDVEVNGGTAQGTGRVGLVGEKPQHALKLTAKDVRIDADLAPLLSRAAPILAVGDAGDAGGRAGIDLDVTAKGLDADKLRNSVSGQGTLHLDGVYAESRNWIGKLLDLAGAGTRLEVPRADVPFTVKRGKVTTEKLDMVGKKMDLRLGGDVGLDGTLDYTFLVKPKGGSAKLEKYASLLDADGYLPLRLAGSVFDPELKLPSLSDALEGGVKERLGGLLDGLLNRDDDAKKKEQEEKDEQERRKRREERRKRKQKEAEQGGDTPPPEDDPAK